MNSSPLTSRARRSFATNDQKWDAVLRNDAGADGRFFYSVRTTGVYCRPSCPSRAPQRENVAFHASCAAAERAGFRACKRCQPNGAGLAAQHAEIVARACRLIAGAEKAPALVELARTLGLSPFHFHRIFTRATGLSPKAYALARRAEKVRAEIPRAASVTRAIYDAGYESSGRFYAEADRTLGMSPRALRQGGAGATLRFAVAKCYLGSILVAASDKGVCAILLGDRAEPLVTELQRRFPRARLVGDDGPFGKTVARVLAFVENPRLGLELPLDIRGTVFQQRVWRALTEIPLGQTASYTEVARRLGLPRAVRAVAKACAANALAVVIPCHRVIRADGDLSGYRWGLERKSALLRKEGEEAPPR